MRSAQTKPRRLFPDYRKSRWSKPNEGGKDRCIMSESNEPDDSDEFDEAIERVRAAFDSAVEEAEKLSDQAREDVEEAIDELERRLESLRGEE